MDHDPDDALPGGSQAHAGTEDDTEDTELVVQDIPTQPALLRAAFYRLHHNFPSLPPPVKEIIQRKVKRPCMLMCCVVTAALLLMFILLLLRYGGLPRLPTIDLPRGNVARLALTSGHILYLRYSPPALQVVFNETNWFWLHENGDWATLYEGQCYEGNLPGLGIKRGDWSDLVKREGEWQFVDTWESVRYFLDYTYCPSSATMRTQYITASRKAEDVLWQFGSNYTLDSLTLELVEETNASMVINDTEALGLILCEEDCMCLDALYAQLSDVHQMECRLADERCIIRNRLIVQAIRAARCKFTTECRGDFMRLPVHAQEYCPGLGGLLDCDHELKTASFSLRYTCEQTFEHFEDFVAHTYYFGLEDIPTSFPFRSTHARVTNRYMNWAKSPVYWPSQLA